MQGARLSVFVISAFSQAKLAHSLFLLESMLRGWLLDPIERLVI